MNLTGIIIFIVVIIIISWIIKVKREEREYILWKCDWCGEEYQTIYLNVKNSIKYRKNIYCCGRCERADEASAGVKEKRIRWIDHE